MVEAERRQMDLPEKVAVAALIGAAITLIGFGGVLSAVFLLVVALMGCTRGFEQNAARGKPTISNQTRLIVGGTMAALAAIYHPVLSASSRTAPEPLPTQVVDQQTTEAAQAKVPVLDPAERQRKLASLIAGEREMDQEDFEGRLIFWDQIVALAPDNVEFNRKREDAKRQVDELAIYRDQPELGAEIVKVSNRLKGFGIISVIDVTIHNRALSDLKDFQISCEHMGGSGTVISRTSRTLFEVVPARTTKSFHNINMGVVSPQSKKFSCRIDGASIK